MKTYKLTKEDKKLIEQAEKISAKSKQVKLKEETGNVGAALITHKGNIYRGVCIGFYCGIGSCGEYQAIGSMISNGEKEIKTIVAVWHDDKNKKYAVIPPCGKCREMIHQLGKRNWNSWVIISKTKKTKLKELLPLAWDGTIEK